jgi:O-6-methylguanine DNA methyltransferase
MPAAGSPSLTAVAAAHLLTPLGPAVVLASDSGVTALQFDEPHNVTLPISDIARHAARELAEYFALLRTSFTIPLVLPPPSFERSVLDALLKVPYGETCSYAEVANAAGHRGAARAAGSVLARNELLVLLPCHRVLPATGDTGMFALGPSKKRFLLELERQGTQNEFL